MQALTFSLSLARVAGARALGRRSQGLCVSGPLSGLRLADIAEPDLPGRGWLRVQVESCGLCGSDLALSVYKTSAALSPWSSFPCVLGHEILGRVVEAGPEVDAPRVGDRVAVDPFLGCEAREVTPCPACAAGRHAVCERQLDGPWPGMLLGMTASLPGGFCERLVVHRSQAVSVPEELGEDTAALLEPLGVASHAVLRRPPRDGERVLVIGGGTIGLCTTASLRLLGFAGDVTAVVRTEGQGELAGALGADRFTHGRGRELDESLAEVADTRMSRPIMGEPLAVGGFELVIDAVGSRESLSLALRMARPRGSLILVGAAGEVPKLDLSAIWARELTVYGTLAYGREEAGSRTMDLLARKLTEGTVPVERMISERVALEDWAGCFQRNLDRDRTGVVKSLLVPGGRKGRV